MSCSLQSEVVWEPGPYIPTFDLGKFFDLNLGFISELRLSFLYFIVDARRVHSLK